MIARLRIEIKPTGKARPRERGRLPTAYREWKKTASGLLAAELRRVGWEMSPDDPHRRAVGVRVVGYHPRPARAPRWCDVVTWKRNKPFLRLSTPDCDNLEGAVWDALSDTGLCWHDDTQAVSLGCWQYYGRRGQTEPYITVGLVAFRFDEHPEQYVRGRL